MQSFCPSVWSTLDLIYRNWNHRSFGVWHVVSSKVAEAVMADMENHGLVFQAFCGQALKATIRTGHAHNKTKKPPATSIPSILPSMRINPGIVFGPAVLPARPMHAAIDLLSRRRSSLHWMSSHRTAELPPSKGNFESEGVDGLSSLSVAHSAGLFRFQNTLVVPGILPQNDVSVKDKPKLRESARKSCPTTTAPASFKVGCRWLP